jgi:Flp pilus assembly protein TadD
MSSAGEAGPGRRGDERSGPAPGWGPPADPDRPGGSGGPPWTEIDPAEDALQRSSALVDVGRTAEAETALRRALADDPEDPFLLTELARVLLVAGRPREAVPQADRAVVAAPEWSHAHAMRALALIGPPLRSSDAVAAARRAAELDPESPFARRTLSRALLAARHLVGAREAAEQAVRLDPENADSHCVKGAVLLEQGRHVEAEAAYRDALRRDPHDAEALNNLGVAVQAQGAHRGPDSRALFEQAARAHPTDEIARGNLAADARLWVNGRWAWGLVVYALLRAVAALAEGDPDDLGVAVIALVVAVGLSTYLIVRGRRRTAALSPAAQRVLREQRWWERIRLSSWRPIFWLIPAPIWMGISGSAAAFWATDLVGGTADDPTATGIALALSLVVLALTGRRTWRRFGVPWWAARRG